MYLSPAKRNTDLNQLSIGFFDMPEEIVIRLIYAAMQPSGDIHMGMTIDWQ